MRCLMLLSVFAFTGLALAGCGALDTAPGSSGFPDTAVGRAGRTSGVITTGGQIVLDREQPPGQRMPRSY